LRVNTFNSSDFFQLHASLFDKDGDENTNWFLDGD
jgi:hypothetical protein